VSFLHRELAAGRWAKMPFIDQMANAGSEVERAIAWRERKHEERAVRAADRALELLDLTLASADTPPRRREVARVRECFADFFYAGNGFGSTAAQWRRYFTAFAFAARRDR